MTRSSLSTEWHRPLPLAALSAVVVAVVLTAFAWPAARSAPRDLPIAVAGPAAGVEEIAGVLEEAEPGAFAVRSLTHEAAARTAIANREIYGAVVIGGQGPKLLVASAASPAVAQVLRQLATGLGAASGADVIVEDVVPTPEADPRGAGLGAAALPLSLGGIITAALVARQVRRPGPRIAAVLAMAVGGGMVTATVLGTWLGSIESGWWVTAGVVALGMSATALVLLGLYALAREAGLAIGAATIVLLGNPLSGLATAPELLPSGWGTLGQLLPPGATGTLLRSVSWFDGAGAGTPLLVLSGWCLVGLLLLAVGTVTTGRRRPAPDVVREPVAV